MNQSNECQDEICDGTHCVIKHVIQSPDATTQILYNGFDADENQIGSDTLLLLQIDTKKKLIREWSDFSNLFHPEWEITKITNYNYYSKKPVGYNDSEIDFTTRASFNRYTGSFTSRLNKDKALYVYNCQPTSQLY